MKIGRLAACALAGITILGWFEGCSSTGGANGGDAGASICGSSCQTSCNADSDCNTADDELCCDYGSAGKACAPATACPIFCAGGTTCQTPGQTCVDISLVPGTSTACEPPGSGLNFCQADSTGRKPSVRGVDGRKL